MDFVVEISTFQKKIEITFGGVGWSKTVAWDPGGACRSKRHFRLTYKKLVGRGQNGLNLFLTSGGFKTP